MKYCPQCGALNLNPNRVCPGCGYNPHAANSRSPLSIIMWVLLGVVLTPLAVVAGLFLMGFVLGVLGLS